MPRKTRILHGEDEYLFVDTPGDDAGPTLLILARPGNARAVPAGSSATHQSEHGQWCPVARFDGETLLLAPDPPAGLADRLNEMLPRYAELQRQRIATAKNGAWYLAVDGRAVHALHPAQPSGLLLRLFRDEAGATAALQEMKASSASSRAMATGDLREFLELRAEEGFAGALLDDVEVVFFLLDKESHVEFVKVSSAEGEREVHSELLDARSRWQLYEGDEELDALVDPDRWDRLMRRVFGPVPFVGFTGELQCLTFMRGDAPVTVDVEGTDDEAGETIVPLFHDPQTAEAFRVREKLGSEKSPKVKLEAVGDLRVLLQKAAELGAVARLQPGDHRARGGVLWCDEEDVLLDSFSGLWRSRDGRHFEPIAE